MPERKAGGDGMTILIVEDDAACAAYIEALVTKMGELCIKAETTEKALDFMSVGKFNGVLCDLVLESGSGLEVAKAARAIGIPVVFVTSTEDDYNTTLMHEYGFVLRKPARMNGLARAIEYFKWAAK